MRLKEGFQNENIKEQFQAVITHQVNVTCLISQFLTNTYFILNKKISSNSLNNKIFKKLKNKLFKKIFSIV
jgi:C4-type Zn-finger protein